MVFFTRMRYIDLLLTFDITVLLSLSSSLCSSVFCPSITVFFIKKEKVRKRTKLARTFPTATDVPHFRSKGQRSKLVLRSSRRTLGWHIFLVWFNRKLYFSMTLRWYFTRWCGCINVLGYLSWASS